MAHHTDKDGNWKRTVRCSHCYEKGHNVSSCTVKRERLAKSIVDCEERILKNEWEYDWEKADTKRRLESAKNILGKYENRGKNRKCGYCKEPGHTRRTCPTRKNRVEEVMNETIDFRTKMCDKFISAGLGPGALIYINVEEHVRTDSGQSEASLAIVTSIDFGKVFTAHKYDGSRYHYNYPRYINAKLVQPIESRWSGKMIEEVCEIPAIEFLNTDNHEISENFQHKKDRGMISVASPVLCGRDIMCQSSVNPEILRKVVLENIVDPK